MNEISVACRSEGDEYDNYLLAENGERMKFPTKEHAIRYLKEHSADDEEIYFMSFIYTNESRECECHLCEKRDDCFIAYKFQRLPRNPDGTGGLGMCPKL